MRNDVEVAVEKASGMIKGYKPKEVGETDEFLIVYYDEAGIPPVFFHKKTGSVSLLEYGNRRLMEMAYKSAKVVQTFQREASNE